MAKIFTFADGTSIEFAEGSTATNLVGVYSTFAEIDSILEKFTADNVNGGTFEGNIVDNLVPLGVQISSIVANGENVTAAFVSRAKTEVELLQESQELQNQVLDALMMIE